MKKNLITSFLLGAGFLSMAAPLLAAGNQPEHRSDGTRIHNPPAIEGCAIGLRQAAEGPSCSLPPPPAPPPMATPQPQPQPEIVGYTFVNVRKICTVDAWLYRSLKGSENSKPYFVKARFGMFVGQGGGDGGGACRGDYYHKNLESTYTFSCVSSANPQPSPRIYRTGVLTVLYPDGTSREDSNGNCPIGTGPILLESKQRLVDLVWANQEDTGGGG